MRGRRDEARLNPTLRLYRSGTPRHAVDVEWTVRQRGTQQRALTLESDGELVAFLLSELSGRRDVVGSRRLRREMRDTGMLIGPDDVPRAVELDLHLPRSTGELGSPAAGAARALVVSEFAHVVRDGAIPEALRGRADRGALLPGAREVLWVDDPDTGALALYDLSDEQGQLACALVRGERRLTDLPGPLVGTLATASVLVSHGAGPAAASRRAARGAVLHQAFRRDELVVVRRVINPVQLAMFRPYLRGLVREGWLRWDKLDDTRLLLHREPLCEFLHHQLCALVQDIVGEPVKPSYSIYAHYKPGATLARHRDRPQCKFNVSLVLDAEPGLDEAPGDPWPLYIETRTGVHAAALAPGDAVLYSGTDSWHWRDAQPAGCRMGGAFFHFVPASFTGSLD